MISTLVRPDTLVRREVEITDAARDALEQLLRSRLGSDAFDPDRDTTLLGVMGTTALREVLPAAVIQAVASFRTSGAHALCVLNIPGQPLPATPVGGFADEHELALTNAVQLGLINLMNAVPYAVSYENDGRLFRNVVANPAAAGTTSSWGADTEFFWHTDNPHLPFGRHGHNPRPAVPRYLTFTALRNVEQVATEIAAVEEALGLLDPATVRLLTEPRFRVGAPASVDQALSLVGAPLLEPAEFRPHVRFDLGTTEGVDPEASRALEEWVAALEQVRGWEPVLEGNQFLAFDNYGVLHRRRAFTPAEPDKSRWLRRCYAS